MNTDKWKRILAGFLAILCLLTSPMSVYASGMQKSSFAGKRQTMSSEKATEAKSAQSEMPQRQTEQQMQTEKQKQTEQKREEGLESESASKKNPEIKQESEERKYGSGQFGSDGKGDGFDENFTDGAAEPKSVRRGRKRKKSESEKAKCEERGKSCIRQHLSDGTFQCGDAG